MNDTIFLKEMINLPHSLGNIQESVIFAFFVTFRTQFNLKFRPIAPEIDIFCFSHANII